MTDVARRELILKAADRLLRHYGPQKTTVSDVAREAGIGVGSVYLEFPSKEAIVEELSRARYEAVLAAMREAAFAEGRAHGERLTAALDARLATYLEQAEEGAHACDLFHCSSAAVKSAAEQFHEDERALLVEMLRAGREAGELSVVDYEKTARAILRAYKSLTPPFIFMQSREAMWEEVKTLHDLVLRGVLSRGGAEST